MLTAATTMRNSEQRGDAGMAAGLGEDAFAGVDEDDGESAVDAPVAMLRVYCSWPGVSAMMNLRCGVEK